MKRITTMTLALVMAVMFAARTQAEMKPVVVVSIASYSDLAGDVDYLGSLANQPNASAQLGAMITLMTGGQPGEMMDTEQPLGVVVGVDEAGAFHSIVFAPITAPDKIYGIISSFGGAAEDAGDGVKKFNMQGQDLYLKATDGWVFAGQSLEDFAELPANPKSLLGDMADNYDLGVTAYLQNVPANLRDMAMQGLMQGMSMRMPGEDDASYEARTAMMDTQMEAMKQLFDDLDQLSIGFNIDSEDKSIYLDLNMSAVPGSDLAEQMASSADMTTEFGGFTREDAMLSMSVVGEMSAADIQNAKAQMGSVRDQMIAQMKAEAHFDNEEDEAFMTEWANDVMDLVEATIETGKGDLGLAVVGDDTISFAMGMHVASGDQAEALFDKFVEFIASKGAPVEDVLQRNAATVDGVRFNTITPPANEVDDEMRMIFGDAPVFAVGFGEDKVYLGFGTGIMDSLEEMMAQSKATASEKVLPFNMSASVANIVNFASKVSPEAAGLAGAIQPGDDHVRITSTSEGVTATTRIKVEEGVLRFLAAMGQQFGAAAAPR